MDNFKDNRTIRLHIDSGVVCPSENQFAKKDISANDFKVGDKIVRERYEIREILGRGGMGIVYRCYDTVTRMDVALKTLPPEIVHSYDEMEEIRSNFSVAGQLNHPNIATMRTLEESDGRIFLVMDFVDGISLKRWVRNHCTDGNLVFADFILIMKQIASALDYAHSKGVLHRDIKPQNIMVTKDDTAKLLDFGLAAQIQNSMNRVSMAVQDVCGTTPYMAPEQWRGRGQRPATDQYAFAVIVYEIFAGRPPFENPNLDILRQCVLNELPEPLEQLDDSMNNALQKALSKEPKDRFPSCADFISAFAGDPIQGEGPTSSFSTISQNDLSNSQIAQPKKLALDANLEVYILSDKVEQLKRKIDACSPDGGQTFELHLKNFMNARANGQNALKKGDRQSAISSFQNAFHEAKWVLDNIPLRKRASELLEKNKKNIDFVAQHVKSVNPDSLARAKAGVEYGRDLYRQGNFSGAIKCLEDSFVGVLPFVREGLLRQCEKSVKEKDWGALNLWTKRLSAYDTEKSAHFKEIVDKEAKRSEKRLNIFLICVTAFPLLLIFCLIVFVDTNAPVPSQKDPVPVVQQENMDIAQINDLLVNGDIAGFIEKGMVKIEPGTFTMAQRDAENYDDEVAHQVTLTQHYWIAKTEVTQKQWESIIWNNPSFTLGDNYPVNKISWKDAQKFLSELNRRYGHMLPNGYKFDLPTEAQWEYAAQGGYKRQSYTKYAGSDSLDSVGWYANNSGDKVHIVGTKEPNNLGLYDMSGNVYEWCRDWYGAYNGDATDPSGPASGSGRVVRGGSWCYGTRSCRTANRSSGDPTYRYSNFGFRLALVPIQEK